MKTLQVSRQLVLASILLGVACDGSRSATHEQPTSSPTGAAAQAPSQASATGHAMPGHEMPAAGAGQAGTGAPGDKDDLGWAALQALTRNWQHVAPPQIPHSQLEPGVRAELVRQLNLTGEVVRRYPTVKSAEAAGFRRFGAFIPGLGVHYMGPGAVNTGGGDYRPTDP